MGVDRASGTENLRANETIKSGTATQSPSGGGKDCGGTDSPKADLKVMTAAVKGSPTGGANHIPAGVSKYNGEAV